MVSAASAKEIGAKVRLGKLPGAEDFTGNLIAFVRVSVRTRADFRGTRDPRWPLTAPHKDPFDRMLVAQSLAENLPVVSNDSTFDSYRVRRLW